MLASTLYFSAMSALVKLVGERLTSHQIALVRGLLCTALAYAWLRAARVAPWGRHRVRLVLRGLFGTVSLLCFYHSLVALPMAEAVTFQHLRPIMTAGLAALLLGERLRPRVLVALACGLVGALAITRPAALTGWLAGAPEAVAAAAPLPPLSVAIALAGALASAFVFVLVRSLGDREHPLVVVFYFPLVTVPIALPLALTGWVWPTAAEWVLLAGVGLTTHLAQVHMTRGLALEPAGRAASVGYLEVALAAAAGAAFFGELPDLVTLGGAALILLGTLVVAVVGAASVVGAGADGAAVERSIRRPRP